MDYINKVLGIEVKYEKWDKIKELPYYLTTLYKFEIAHLDTVRTLFVYPKGRCIWNKSMYDCRQSG